MSLNTQVYLCFNTKAEVITLELNNPSWDCLVQGSLSLTFLSFSTESSIAFSQEKTS